MRVSKDSIINQSLRANVFSDFFSTVVHQMQSKVKFSSKSFSDFLPPDIIMWQEIISKITSSLNSSKSVGLNSILTEILKPLHVQISKYLTDIFDLPFTTGIFLNSLKSAKVISIHKKL